MIMWNKKLSLSKIQFIFWAIVSIKKSFHCLPGSQEWFTPSVMRKTDKLWGREWSDGFGISNVPAVTHDCYSEGVPNIISFED